MAKEAIEAVKEAEAQAMLFYRKQLKPRDLMQTAEALAEDKYRRLWRRLKS